MKYLIGLFVCFCLLGCSHVYVHKGCDMIGEQLDGKYIVECED